jgi:hypothetical protein
MGNCVNCGAAMQGEGTLCERCLEEPASVDVAQIGAPWREYVRPAALAAGAALLLTAGAFVVVKIYKNGLPAGADTDELLEKANQLLDSAPVAGAASVKAANLAGDKALRLTQQVREQLLALNEGFTWSTNNKQRNFTEHRVYKIVNNQLHIFAEGKTSWADSRYAKEWVASAEETHRFLRNYRGVLRTDGIG